jgi:WD40 repeat protein
VGVRFGTHGRRITIDALDFYGPMPSADPSTRAAAAVANAIYDVRPEVSRRHDPAAIRVAIVRSDYTGEAVPWPLADSPSVLQGSRGPFTHYSGDDARSVIDTLSRSLHVRIGSQTFAAAWAPAIEMPRPPDWLPPAQWLPSQASRVLSIDWCLDGRLRIVAVSPHAERVLHLWNSNDPGAIKVLRGHTSWVREARWSPDEPCIASASLDGTLRIWDAATGATLAVLTGHKRDVESVDWSPDGRRLASASADGTVRIWNRSGRPEQVLRQPDKEPWSVRWSPDGHYLAVGETDGFVRLWDAKTGSSVVETALGSRRPQSLPGMESGSTVREAPHG